MSNIAIIGSGISGLTCGYHLCRKHHITLYEANDYIGGHTHTVTTRHLGENHAIDTGFIVFNNKTYPEFIRLITELEVNFQPTEMSFSVRNDLIDLEYNGHSLSTLFAQKKNLVRPGFWIMLKEIIRFNREVRIQAEADQEMTIGQYLSANNYSTLFRQNYLLPMVSAIWSMGLNSCMDFPLAFFVRFFDNHGLLDIVNRPQWYTIQGGSSSYIAPLTRGFAQNIKLNTPVLEVRREKDKVRILTSSGSEMYDEVIFACHGDDVLPLLANPTSIEQEVLNTFTCSDNIVTLHTDVSLLPTRRAAWASWNYNMVDSATELSTLTYNMNILQRLESTSTYLVSLNQEVKENHIIDQFRYRHPVYTTESILAQQRWSEISGKERIHFCGAYWRNGFHEDGVVSALRVCHDLEKKQ